MCHHIHLSASSRVNCKILATSLGPSLHRLNIDWGSGACLCETSYTSSGNTKKVCYLTSFKVMSVRRKHFTYDMDCLNLEYVITTATDHYRILLLYIVPCKSTTLLASESRCTLKPMDGGCLGKVLGHTRCLVNSNLCVLRNESCYV